MELTFYGNGCIKLAGKNITIVTDPLKSNSDQAKQALKADVVLQTGLNVDLAESPGMVIDGPGEYEVKGAMITGVPARLHIDEDGSRATIYSVLSDGANIVVIGNVDPQLDDKQIEPLGQVHVLVIPIGGHGLTLDATAAANIISKLEPTYVIPVHYNDGVSEYAVPQDAPEDFLKEMGSNPEPVAKFRLSSKDMPAETTVLVLSHS